MYPWKEPKDRIPLAVRQIARVEAMVKQGKTLEQIKEARPTADFDERWGKLRRGDLFVEFVYYGYVPYRK